MFNYMCAPDGLWPGDIDNAFAPKFSVQEQGSRVQNVTFLRSINTWQTLLLFKNLSGKRK